MNRGFLAVQAIGHPDAGEISFSETQGRAGDASIDGERETRAQRGVGRPTLFGDLERVIDEFGPGGLGNSHGECQQKDMEFHDLAARKIRRPGTREWNAGRDWVRPVGSEPKETERRRAARCRLKSKSAAGERVADAAAAVRERGARSAGRADLREAPANQIGQRSKEEVLKPRRKYRTACHRRQAGDFSLGSRDRVSRGAPLHQRARLVGNRNEPFPHRQGPLAQNNSTTDSR